MEIAAASPSLISECFPARLRCGGASIGFHHASIVAGGPSLLVPTALLAAFRSGYVMPLYTFFRAVVSVVVPAFLPDYTNRHISREHGKSELIGRAAKG
jgi:hypothetical protein